MRVLQATLVLAHVEVCGRPVGRRERMALASRIAALQTLGVHVDGFRVQLGLEEHVAVFSETRRHYWMIVINVDVQRRHQHFVFAKHGAREHEPAFGQLLLVQSYVDVAHYLVKQQPSGVVTELLVF